MGVRQQKRTASKGLQAFVETNLSTSRLGISSFDGARTKSSKFPVVCKLKQSVMRQKFCLQDEPELDDDKPVVHCSFYSEFHDHMQVWLIL